MIWYSRYYHAVGNHLWYATVPPYHVTMPGTQCHLFVLLLCFWFSLFFWRFRALALCERRFFLTVTLAHEVRPSRVISFPMLLLLLLLLFSFIH